MQLFQQIQAYQPCCEQEERDRLQMLTFMESCSDYLDRTNLTAHFSASVWVVNPDRSKVLMVYHNLYDSWSWIGGHADGEADLCAVALRELEEETGVQHARLISPDVFSLESLPVFGHEKRGVYVPTHLHMNLTYLVEADEDDTLRIKPDENQGVRWFTFDEALTRPTEAWMVERVYRKLIEKLKR